MTPAPSSEAPLPVLYSFRRCPYAMRARLALMASGQACELREVVLRNKPEALRQASAKATVPVLVHPDGTVIEQSLEIMRWALGRQDPGDWLRPAQGTLEEMLAAIAQIDGSFKFHLDRYKYPGRYPSLQNAPVTRPADPADPAAPTGPASAAETAETVDTAKLHRSAAADVLLPLAARLRASRCLFGPRPTLADMAIAPFVRQYAHVDAAWFAAQPWPELVGWLEEWQASDLLASVMAKYPPWPPGMPGVRFG
jgi:glutathione S-transferase